MKTLKTLITATALSVSLGAQAAPVVNLFELGIAPNQQAAYNQVGERNIRQSIADELGTLAMYSLRAADNENLAYMFEIYADEAAYQAHLQSPQYQAFLAASPTILTDHKKRTALLPQYLGEKAAPLVPTPEAQVNLVTVTVNPEMNQAFADIVIPEMVESMRVESGVLAMYAATAQDEPNKWYFLEIYAANAAYQQHRQTPHFKDYLARTAAMSSDKAFIDVQPVMMKNKGGLGFVQRRE